MKKPLSIYHANCADGFMAASIVYSVHGDSYEYVAAQYGDAPPDCSGRDVVIVDFSYKRDVLKSIAAEANHVTILDHHESAQRELEGLEDELPNAKIIFDMTKSGAGLTWLHFKNGDPTYIVRRVQDRDLWKFEFQDTKAITTALFSHPMDFETWVPWVHPLSIDIAELVSEGTALLRKHDQDVQKVVERASEGTIDEFDGIPIVNCLPQFTSDACNILAKGKPFAAAYSLVEKDGELQAHFSLRSDKNGVNVAEIAERHGGGGHKHAAGFALKARLSLDELR